jgi:molybdopterin synthase catalytic subunit
MIQLTDDAIDTQYLLALVQRPEAGAVVLFLGTTRQFTKGRETVQLTYEAYREMAHREIERLETEARRRWSLVECAIVHRLGVVALGEASVAIAVSSSHRDDAFEAGRWLIDTLKETAPIWKQEHWADGSMEWIHPVESTAGREAAE